jgi:hypothetical protein
MIGARLSIVLLVVGSCREPPPAEQERVVERPTASAIPSAAPVKSATPSATPTGCQWAWTATDPSFVDCNPNPAQRDYPECFNYSVTDASGAAGCPPKEVEITVSGGPGTLESHRARVEVSDKEIRFLEGTEVIATASVESGKVTGFRAGRKLPAFHRGAQLKP